MYINTELQGKAKSSEYTVRTYKAIYIELMKVMVKLQKLIDHYVY